jgi:biotin transport system substrate-specific component
MTTLSPARPVSHAVLADVLPGARVHNAVLVACGALLTVLGAQISIHVPPSPVPITGQTLAVVLAGGALGARRGAASQALYVALGLFLPVYSDGEQGVDVIWGATGGYLVGFVVAAGIVGWCAERGADRRPLVAFTAFAAGQLSVFAIGVPWLKVATDMAWDDAIHDGFAIFIVGGIVKAALAGALFPGAWRLVRRLDATRSP